jgi:hypothetical protein
VLVLIINPEKHCIIVKFPIISDFQFLTDEQTSKLLIFNLFFSLIPLSAGPCSKKQKSRAAEKKAPDIASLSGHGKNLKPG